ncbi:MAG: hypothetical protein V1794_15170 [Candidatus Glassbacteria bacterium]
MNHFKKEALLNSTELKSVPGKAYYGRKKSVVKLRIFALLVAAAAVWTTCSKDRGDPLSVAGGTGDFGGSLASGKNGPNLAVTEQNKLEFCWAIFHELYPSFLKAVNGTAIVPISGDQVRILGTYTGYAIASLPPKTSGTSATVNGLELTYFDYSESGTIFLGGKAVYSGEFIKNDLSLVPNRFVLDTGGLVFAGKYSASVKFDDFRIFFDSWGVMINFITELDSVICFLPLQGDMFIESGDNSLLFFNPYFRACIDPYADRPD